jgi:hypothetical protein
MADNFSTSETWSLYLRLSQTDKYNYLHIPDVGDSDESSESDECLDPYELAQAYIPDVLKRFEEKDFNIASWPLYL